MAIWYVTPHNLVNGLHDKSNLLPPSSDDGGRRLLRNLGTQSMLHRVLYELNLKI
jgi:hypothetical protein